MGFFKKADVAKTIRVNTPDGEDWIELYSDLNKAQINKIILMAPKDNSDTKGALTFVEQFFDIVVKDWSMVDEAGNHVAPSKKEYLSLAAEPAKWVESVLSDHVTRTLNGGAEAVEGKVSE